MAEPGLRHFTQSARGAREQSQMIFFAPCAESASLLPCD